MRAVHGSCLGWPDQGNGSGGNYYGFGTLLFIKIHNRHFWVWLKITKTKVRVPQDKLKFEVDQVAFAIFFLTYMKI